ncbi:hypothetical protein JQ604_32050 [Bradyrhizobium jicamae]|uniref:hypothetical protein n=1 Tax=Bradyrhizobium jicamae TaxID=280332 RepID=UPI001BA99A95|nr:hypothetical protein [Bradyrhizobium jicamae]MBR0756837.1 hypothetical protein [Bradyrhizobium jicamae]
MQSAHDIHVVRVTTDDGERQLWLAATERDEAVDRVLDAIPEGWTATLIERKLSDEHAASLNMAPGEIRHHQLS